MVGFKRTNIQGYTVVADPELVRLVRRHATSLLGQLFRDAQEHGESHIQINEQRYRIIRRPDHTFTITDVVESHHVI